MAFDLPNVRSRLAALAAGGIRIGTSSWKYPGWCWMVYDEQRYLTNKKFSEAKFDRSCLPEYAETFRTVCIDAGYYAFPNPAQVAALCAQVSEGFQFGTKVTDDITLRTFPSLPRFGLRSGKLNPHFLDAYLFRRAFLAPWEPHRDKLGPIVFEFSTFQKRDFEHGRDFMSALDVFLGNLPRGWRYGVELRNKAWLQPEYFAMLRSHNVAHTFNSWSRMPAVHEQMALPGSDTADFLVARLLLRQGRTYAAAVEAFQPYSEIKDTFPEVRESIATMARRLFGRRPGYIYVNNRLEGSAPLTIASVLEAMGALAPIEEQE